MEIYNCDIGCRFGTRACWVKVTLPILPKIGCHGNVLQESEKRSGSRKCKQIPPIWWKKNRENRSSRSSDNVSQLITRKRKKLKQAKCIARSASLPSGLNKKRYVPPLIETCHEGANVSSPYALVLSRLHVRKVCDDKSYSNTIGLWSAAFIPSFGGTSINAIAFPCIGQSFLIVSRSSSSLTSISSAKLTHTQRKV